MHLDSCKCGKFILGICQTLLHHERLCRVDTAIICGIIKHHNRFFHFLVGGVSRNRLVNQSLIFRRKKRSVRRTRAYRKCKFHVYCVTFVLVASDHTESASKTYHDAKRQTDNFLLHKIPFIPYFAHYMHNTYIFYLE